MPTVEVHMTNIEKRGSHSVTAEAAAGYVAGFGLDSYLGGIEMALRLVGARKRLAEGG
ncbi:3-dehydroquinate dehydratase [compost metagenome]